MDQKIILYYTQITFIKYIHEHLLKRAVDVKREREYICPRCNRTIKDKEAIKIRLEVGKKDIHCQYCDKKVTLIDLIEKKFASDKFEKKAHELDQKAQINIDNECLELILEGHTKVITEEAGCIYRGYINSDHGIDGEIEFKTKKGSVSSKKVYLQLKSRDSFLNKRQKGRKEVFTIKKEHHIKYWQSQPCDVYLVIRTSDGEIRWMNVTKHLKKRKNKTSKQIIFKGEPFNVANLLKLRIRILQGVTH